MGNVSQVFFLETLKGAASGSGRGGDLLMALENIVTQLPILCLLTPYIVLSVLTVVPWSQGHRSTVPWSQFYGANSIKPTEGCHQARKSGAIKPGLSVCGCHQARTPRKYPA